MPISPPSQMYPVATSFWAIGKESAPSTPATAFTCIPSAAFAPSDKPQWIEDMALRGSPVKVYNMQQGPLWAEHTIPESPVFGDTIGHVLLSLLGDYTTTGTAGTPTWTASAAITAGAGPIAVTSGSSAVAGTFVQIDSAANAEVVKVGTGSTATSLVIDASTPIRFSHLTATAITTVAAPYTHVFSLLNMGSSTGNTSCQPPTHTLIHRTGLPGSGNNLATQYAYGCVTEVKLSGKANGMLTWEGKITSYSRSYPGAPVTAAFSTVRMIPSWRSVTTMASSVVPNVTEWSVTMTREMDVVTAANGQQQPYALGRGDLASTFNLEYDASIDEGPLNMMLANTQPTLSWATSNGGSGAGLVSLGINAGLAGFKGADLKAQKVLWGYSAQGDLLPTTSLAGNSAGYSPVQLTLVNQVASY